MIRLPDFRRVSRLKNQIVERITDHKTLITVSSIIVISLIAFGVFAVKLRAYLLSKIETVQQTTAQPPPSDIYYATTAGDLSSNFTSLYASDAGVLEVSPAVENDETFPTPTPYPIVTEAPLPVVTPEPITTTDTSSASSCTGTPTVDNSQVYVSPSTTQVNSTSTISVDLSDCNNTTAPVTDTLTIALVSGDSGTKINGSLAPVTIETQNGKVSFSVTSPNATTATFLITDTTRSFQVTTPGYHNPSVTFTNNSSGNAHCTTAAGVPNLWYSDVYPNPPISTTNGSIGLIVDIYDCNQQLAPVSDTLNISVSSGNSDTQMNGGSLPQNVTTQNGEARFTISSQMNGTVTLSVQDTTSGFTVTNINSANPSITFSGSPASTPTDTPTPTPAPVSTDTPTPVPTDTPTPTPASPNTPTSNPTGPS